MSHKNSPGGRRGPELEPPPASQTYEVVPELTLVDGSTVKLDPIIIVAPDEEKAAGIVVQQLRGLATTGVLRYFADRREFVVDPTPAQIKSIRATLPQVAIATGGGVQLN